MSSDIGRRRFLVGSGTVATVALAGCAADDEDPVADDVVDDTDDDTTDDTADDDQVGEEPEDQQLELIQAPRESIDPIGIAGPINAWQNWQIHEGLFTYEDGIPPVVGSLAEDYTISDDYLTYTFELEQGVTFHNGEEVTADDFVYSWRRLAESENNRGHGDRIVGGPMSVEHELDEDEDLVPDSLAIEAIDDYTLEMTLETPFHGTLGNLADPRLSVIPEGVVGDIEGYDGEFDYDEWEREHLHGTGPFQLSHWDLGNEIVVEAFDEYHGSTANIDSIRWRVLEDPDAVFATAVNEQNVDIFDLPRSRFDPGLLEVDEDIGGDRRHGSYGPAGDDTVLNYGETSLPRTQYLIFNTVEVPRYVRRAIAHLVDQETIAEQAVRGQGKPAYFLTPPGAFPGGPEEYDELAREEYPYGYGESDIDAAREIMEDAGYDEDNPYETSLQHPSDNQASEWGEIASLLRDLAEAAHIDLDIEESPSSTLVNRAVEGDITIYANWNALTWLEADSTLRFVYPNPFTWTRWGADAEFEYDELSEPAQRATDAWEEYEEHRLPGEENLAVREEAYLELERANWDDMTQLPLWHPIEELYWYDWVDGLEMHGPMKRPVLNDITLDR